MYRILDHKIVDNIMNELWKGQKTDVNATILDYSTAFNLFMDKHHIYAASDNLYQEYKHQAFDDTKNKELTHRFKYFVWKNSIQLRYYAFVVFQICILLLFQFNLTKFNIALNDAKTELNKILTSPAGQAARRRLNILESFELIEVDAPS